MPISLIFLDFDGTLHPLQAHPGDMFCANPLLWQILRACPDVKVVISSSWRATRDLTELRDLVTAGGGEDLSDRIIDVTPSIHRDSRDNHRCREIEILDWLSANETRWPISARPVRWLALDDLAYWFSIPCWSLYLVDYRTGLVPSDVPRVISRLQTS
ncbi:MAG: hypothetical protein H6R18_1970 [Proteobacteria bacterium]|nr:hypothetical protein [Pseudomonadota bacterium]